MVWIIIGRFAHLGKVPVRKLTVKSVGFGLTIESVEAAVETYAVELLLKLEETDNIQLGELFSIKVFRVCRVTVKTLL